MPIESLIWASLILYFLWRVEVLYRQWLKKQESLSDKQLADLTNRFNDLQNQINSLAIQKEYD